MARDQLLRGLRALALGRKSLGDYALTLRPNATSEEQYEQSEVSNPHIEQGLVLEPEENAPFGIRSLGNLQLDEQARSFLSQFRAALKLPNRMEHARKFLQRVDQTVTSFQKQID